jgi:osmoprotectant transport system ATP-binding protein
MPRPESPLEPSRRRSPRAPLARSTPPRSAEGAPALSAIEVSKRYGSVVALDRVTVEVSAGECLALIGESGSGKTTLLRSLNCMVTPDSGAVLVDGQPAARLDRVALRRRIGYVPQDGGLLPHWRVRRNVALVPWLARAPEAGAQADAALRLVGLDPDTFAARWPRELSGGQRQRVAIARGLAASQRVLLLDEPFGALDAITRSDLQETFQQLRQRLGITAVLVTHDLREALDLANRIAVLRSGRIEQVATPAVLLETPATPYVAALLTRARVR